MLSSVVFSIDSQCLNEWNDNHKQWEEIKVDCRVEGTEKFVHVVHDNH